MGPESMFAYTNVGTPYYMSPEQINEMAYNEKSDVWSLGCIMYELACLSPPFEASNSLALAMKIKAGRYPKLPDRYSEDLSRSIKAMLTTEVSKRPTVDDLLQLPQIAIRIRERKNAQQINKVKKQEEEMNKKTGDLTVRADELSRREAALEQKEKACEQRERAADVRERKLDEREAELKKREDGVTFREKALIKSPPALNLVKKLTDENSPSEERTPPLTDRPYLRPSDRRNSYPFHGLTNVIDNMPQL
jgi:NIMA (never in mitosis gene a)-related kinase